MLDEPTRELLARLDPASEPLRVDDLRAAAAAAAASLAPGPEVARCLDTHVKSAGEPSIPIRILVPHQPPRCAIVYFHGGGWMVGGIAERDGLCRHLAVRCAAVVVIVGYRKAPEHRFPAAADDAWAAVRWAAHSLDDVVGAPLPLVVAGDSAGGNLAAVTALRARGATSPTLAGQLLVYPVVDADMTTSSYVAAENQLLLTRRHMEYFLDAYAPSAADRVGPDIAPLRAPDLSGLCPAIVVTAEHDVLRDEAERYVARLEVCGVPVAHRRFDGQMHGYFPLLGVLPAAERTLAWIAEQLSSIIPRSPT